MLVSPLLRRVFIFLEKSVVKFPIVTDQRKYFHGRKEAKCMSRHSDVCFLFDRFRDVNRNFFPHNGQHDLILCIIVILRMVLDFASKPLALTTFAPAEPRACGISIASKEKLAVINEFSLLYKG